MGIEINVSAELPRAGLFRRRPSARTIWKHVLRIVVNETRETTSWWLVSYQPKSELAIVFHPAAEPFTLLHTGTELHAAVKTSSVGPGFHAFCVNLLDKIEQAAGIQWRWSEEADESGYAQHRNFTQLQVSMANFVESGATVVLGIDPDPNSPIAINWSLDRPLPLADDHAVSPMGPWSRNWFERLRESDAESDRLDLAAQFFPWWNEACDAEFHRNVARVLMWSVIRWHPPLDPDEKFLIELALHSLNNANELDPAGAVYADEADELRALLDADPEQPLSVPPPTGIGFYRHAAQFLISDGWRITLPGYFYVSPADNESGISYWWTDRAVRVVIGSFQDRQAPSSAEELLEIPEGIAELDRITHASNDYDGTACFGRLTGENTPTWILLGVVMYQNSLALITVTLEHEADKEWAIDTFNSLASNKR